MSPSTRRVWIEIAKNQTAIHNSYGHPPHGGCGLKSLICGFDFTSDSKSPSTRRVWIEIELNGKVEQMLKTVTHHTEGVD